jgi:hypothetical protein
VRNGLNPTRVYLEQELRDSIGRQIVEETEVSSPVQSVEANSAYSIWSVTVNDTGSYNIGAEVNGVKISLTDQHSLVNFGFSDCAA